MEQHQSPTCSTSWSGHFPVLRGGIVTFTFSPTQPFRIVVSPEPDPCTVVHESSSTSQEQEKQDGCPPASIWLDVSNGWAAFSFGGTSSEQLAAVRDEDHKLQDSVPSTVGLEPGRTLSYWLSFDPDHLTVAYGKGYAMEETTLLSHSFVRAAGPKAGGGGLGPSWSAAGQLFGAEPKRVELQGYDGPPIQSTCVYKAKFLERAEDEEPCVTFARAALTATPPPLVLDAGALNLLDLGRREWMPSASLPPACQVLYQHLASPCIDLDYLDNGGTIRLSEAMEHSLRTPGCLLYNRLQKKRGACFDPAAPPEQCYLRVSVGLAAGTSPGAPYVMEIWPAGHYSPVHNHGNSFGIVKVLHGSLTARIYNKHMSPQAKPLREMTLSKGDITWFSPNWFQTHQLENQTASMCCTLQGFRYGDADDVHWPFMEYQAGESGVRDFLPVSDFTFEQLRRDVLAEYAAAVEAGQVGGLIKAHRWTIEYII